MMARMADTNKDGQITRAEYDTAVKAHFDKVDKNHDGKITPDERKAARDAMRAMHQDRMGGEGDGPPPPPGN
jgi:Ca2+-binding EF-hand superfamily protein